MLHDSQNFPNGADVFSSTASATIEKFRFVKHTTTAEENYKCAPAGVGEKPFGISVSNADLGDPVGVCTSSIGVLEVDGSSVAIAAGDPLKPAADGIGVKAATAADIYGAEALEPATAANVVIRVLLRHGSV